MELVAKGDGYATYNLGALTVTSLCDGFVDMAVSRLRQPGNEPLGEDLLPQLHLVDGGLRLPVNAFAIDTGAEVTLIDTGASNAWHATMGSLPDALRSAGIAADRITTVALTHTHIDHINGLVLPDGRSAFPNLRRVFVPEREMDLFRAETRLERFQSMAEPFADGQRVTPFMHAMTAAGHEVGHSCFRVGSGGETLLVWGDIVHVPSIQFEHPSVAWEFDADQDAARASRLRIMAYASSNRFHIAGAHLDAPGVGRVTGSAGRYRFEPI